MNIQPTETMLNLTRFNTIQKCINIHFGNYELFSDKNQDKDKLLIVEYNVTEYNKINGTKNNERK